MALLSGLNAVVTGSTKGIGRGIALELSKEGARVLINHRGTRAGDGAQSDLQETMRLIRDAGGQEPLVCEADASREGGARHLADVAIRDHDDAMPGR